MTDGQVFAEERQRRIAAYVAGRGRATVNELAGLTGVVGATVRKDLTALEGRTYSTMTSSVARPWRRAEFRKSL
jgi:DeoR/GlpR family transcriptional regulator of sugar metabolism